MTGNGKTVLIVDDDPDFRAAVTPMLELAGYRVIQAGNSSEAAGVFKSDAPDLMVLDGVLPDTDGISWLKELRESGQAIKVIFATAYWREESSFNWLIDKLEVSKVVLKPIEPAKLVEEISRILHLPLPVDRAEATMIAMERLKAARVQYRKKLPGKVTEVVEMLEEIQRSRWNPGLMGEVRLAAHRLRGTAGVYGFGEVGEAAGEVEDLLVRSLENNPGEVDLLCSQTPAVIEGLRDVMAAVFSSGESGGAGNPGGTL